MSNSFQNFDKNLVFLIDNVALHTQRALGTPKHL